MGGHFSFGVEASFAALKESISWWLVEGRHKKKSKVYIVTVDYLFTEISRNRRRMGNRSSRMANGRTSRRQSEVGGCLVGRDGWREKTGLKLMEAAVTVRAGRRRVLASRCREPRRKLTAEVAAREWKGTPASRCQEPQLKQAAVGARSKQQRALASRCQNPLLKPTAAIAEKQQLRAWGSRCREQLWFPE